VLIIRRINFINTTSGVTLCRLPSSVQVGKELHICILDGNLHTVTHTTCCIDTTDSPDNEHEVGRNM
jgi:hypothetical protein